MVVSMLFCMSYSQLTLTYSRCLNIPGLRAHTGAHNPQATPKATNFESNASLDVDSDLLKPLVRIVIVLISIVVIVLVIIVSKRSVIVVRVAIITRIVTSKL